MVKRRTGLDEFAALQLRQGFDGFAGFLLGEPQVIEILQIEPKLRAGAEEVSETQSGVARNRARAIQICVMRLVGTPSFRASSAALISSASSSSAKCSPG